MQVFLSEIKRHTEFEDDSFYDQFNFNMDDVDFNVDNYEDLFSAALSNPYQLLDSDDIDEPFGLQDMSTSNCHNTYHAEVFLSFTKNKIWKKINK